MDKETKSISLNQFNTTFCNKKKSEDTCYIINNKNERHNYCSFKETVGWKDCMRTQMTTFELQCKDVIIKTFCCTLRNMVIIFNQWNHNKMFHFRLYVFFSVDPEIANDIWYWIKPEIAVHTMKSRETFIRSDIWKEEIRELPIVNGLPCSKNT